MIIDEIKYFAKKYVEAINRNAKPMKYTPMEIIFYMSSPIALNHAWLNFDGLIGHLLLLKYLGKDYYLLPRKFNLFRVINKNDLPESPIKLSHGDLYHSSISFFDTDSLKMEVLYKKFEDRWIKGHRKISKGSGHFRDYMMRHIYIPTRTVSFYVNADRKAMEYLCSLIVGLGDNCRVGYGAVSGFEIKSTDKDYSLIKDGKAMRPIPRRYLKKCKRVVNVAWKPPYWSPENVDICCIPKEEIEIEL